MSQDFILGYFQPSLRDCSLAHANPGLTCWATLSRPCGTQFGEGSFQQTQPKIPTQTYGLSLVKTWSLEMSLNITNAAKISSTTKAAW
jgi:hypothetical protein